MATWVLTDESCNINYKQNGVSHRTLPKELTVLEIVLAGEPLNDTLVDNVFVRYEGKYAMELPWNDTTIGATSYGSAELLRAAILTLLNTNPCAGSGGATGNVVGTPPSVDNAIARYDGITGLLIQNSTVIVTDAGGLNLADAGGNTLTVSALTGIIITPIAGGGMSVTPSGINYSNVGGTSQTYINATGVYVNDGGANQVTLTPTGTLIATDGTDILTVSSAGVSSTGAIGVTAAAGKAITVTSGRGITMVTASGFNFTLTSSGGGKTIVATDNGSINLDPVTGFTASTVTSPTKGGLTDASSLGDVLKWAQGIENALFGSIGLLHT